MAKVQGYSAISTINHWITALLVLALWVLGLTAAFAPSEEVEDFVIGAHISLGFFALLFVVWRVTYRLYEGFPPTLGHKDWERKVAFVVHRTLLVVLVLQVFSGPLYLFTEGEAVDVFGWFAVALPLEGLAVIHEPMEVLHVTLGLYLIPLLLVLHIAGAFRYFLVRGQAETPADMQ